jgi:hypothetical protein
MPIYAKRHQGTLAVRNSLQEPITVVRADGIGVIAARLAAGEVTFQKDADSVTHVSYTDARGERHSVAVRENV